MAVAIVTWKKKHKIEKGKWLNTEKIEKTKSFYKIIKADDVRRTVCQGPVLVPYSEEKQGDIMMPKEIDKAFYDFSGKNVVIKRQHSHVIQEASVFQRFIISET